MTLTTRILLISLTAAFSLQPAAAQTDAVDAARETLAEAAEKSRQEFAGMSWRQFKDTVYKEPFAGGKYIVNGDTTIADEKLLREWYDQNVAAAPSPVSGDVTEFAVHTVGGLQAVWSIAQKRALTYCVSTDFGARYHRVVAEMEQATRAWEAPADIDFIHLMSQDSDCTAGNPNVIFDVRPVQVFGQYLARAFFPNDARRDRNVLIDESSFQLDPNGNLQLVGILRHELGHTLGARHEHTRPESGRCFEDDNWEPLTDYDPFSVMHYPQCNGLGDWSLTLTNTDMNGVACLYGAAPGFTIDPSICTNPTTASATVIVETNESVNRNQENRYGTLQVTPGTQFTATMSAAGSDAGDPDLYVKFDGTPQVGVSFDCRPFLTGADEDCQMTVPAGASVARVMVHGFRDGNYNLRISYVEP